MYEKAINFIKKMMPHIHRYGILLVYPPHNKKCDLSQCKDSNEYGFLLLCDCGKTKMTKLPYGIKSIWNVN